MGLSATSTTPDKSDSATRKKVVLPEPVPTNIFSNRELTPSRTFDKQLDPVQNVQRDSFGRITGRIKNK